MSSPANSTKNSFDRLLAQATHDFPLISFAKSESFYWSSESATIFYNRSEEHASWSLLHELGHMQSGHDTYDSDTRLIAMEVEAWSAATKLSTRYGIMIDEDHIQDCLDSYRGWRHARSKCPVCKQAGLEVNGSYRCINCQKTWRVSDSRFCRTYRMS